MKSTGRIIAAILAAFLNFSVLAAEPEKTPADPQRATIAIASVNRKTSVNFEKEILPLLKANCLACHNKTTTKAELVLETPADILKGGESGRAVVPGHSDDSLLLKVASHQVKPRMPPKDNKVAASDLTPDELGLIKLWIDQGATGTVNTARPIEWEPLPEGLNPIHAVALTPDGQFAACGRANQIFVYHLPSGQFVTRLTDPQLVKADSSARPGVAHRDLVHALAFNPDGTLLASGGYREVKLWQRPQNVKRLTLASVDRKRVTTMAIDPTGKWLATGGEDSAIKLWDAATGKRLKSFSGHKSELRSLQFSPDGSKLISAADKTIRVWDVTSGKTIFQVTAPSEINAVTWVGKGEQIISGHADFIIRAWFVDRTKREMSLVREFRGHEGPVTSLAALPGGVSQFVSGSGDGSGRVWNLDDGQLVRQLKHGGPVSAVAVRADGKRIATAGLNRQAKLWDAEKGELIATLQGDGELREQLHEKQRALIVATNEVAYRGGVLKSAETNLTASVERVKKATDANATAQKNFAEKEAKRAEAATVKASAEKVVAEFDADSKRAIEAVAEAEKAANKADADLKAAKEKSPRDEASETKLSDDAGTKAKALAKAKADLEKVPAEVREKFKQAVEKVEAAAKALTAAEAELKKTEQPKSNAENELALALKAGEQATNAVIEAKNALPVAKNVEREAEESVKSTQAKLESATQPIRAVAFSPDGLTLATAGDDEVVHTWSTETGAAFASFHGHTGVVFGLVFLKNGSLASGGADRSIAIWDLNPAWKLARVIGTGDTSSPLVDRVNAVRFSPDGRLLATGGGEPSRGGEIKLWETATGKLAYSFTNVHSDAVFALDFSPDGKFLASGAADKFAKIVEIATGKVTRTLEGHTHHVLGVSWKADGRALVSAGADNIVKVWDVTSGERKKNIEGFGKEVTSINFVGIGDQALATSGDAKIRMVKMSGEEVRSFSGASDFIFSSAATPDGRIVIAGGEDSVLRVWNGTNGEAGKTFPAPASTNSTTALQAVAR